MRRTGVAHNAARARADGRHRLPGAGRDPIRDLALVALLQLVLVDEALRRGERVLPVVVAQAQVADARGAFDLYRHDVVVPDVVDVTPVARGGDRADDDPGPADPLRGHQASFFVEDTHLQTKISG
jgi:hypothetical protein